MIREVPQSAAWRHVGAREGFETTFFRTERAILQIDGATAAVEDGQPWTVRYAITLDERWTVIRADVWSRSHAGEHRVRLAADGEGGWRVDDAPAPELDGCIDVDLESSACTNTIPVRRLHLGIGESADVPAAYVRSSARRVERLEQRYERVDDDGAQQRYDYRAPRFDFQSRIVYDQTGLAREYPGIASRVV
jgi:uncharacterized protein